MEPKHKEFACRFLVRLDQLSIPDKHKTKVVELVAQTVLQLEDEQQRHRICFALTSPAIRQALKKLGV
jgi:hypothetical protein